MNKNREQGTGNREQVSEAERLEAATEEPTTVGCPSFGIPKLPGGFDGTEAGNTNLTDSTNKTNPSNPLNPSNPCLKVSEEKKKLEDSYLAMRRRLEKITELAVAAAAKCGVSVRIGENWRTCSKAIAEIRRICKESLVEEFVPDYEWLARIMTSGHFEPEALAKAIEAEASKRPIDYPTFYTPGWLCEFAKKLEAGNTNLADSTNKTNPSNPLNPSNPCLKSKRRQDEFHRKYWTFCGGLFPISFVVTQEGFMERCTINGRRFKASVVKEDVSCEAVQHWNGYIYDNGACVCVISGMGKGKQCVKEITHAAFKAYVKQLSGCGGGKYRSKGGFLKQNAARALAAAKQQAHDNKEGK